MPKSDGTLIPVAAAEVLVIVGAMYWPDEFFTEAYVNPFSSA